MMKFVNSFQKDQLQFYEKGLQVPEVPEENFKAMKGSQNQGLKALEGWACALQMSLTSSYVISITALGGPNFQKGLDQ
jgi:hypothetical protein